MGKKSRRQRNEEFRLKSKTLRGSFSSSASGFGFFLPENGEEKECFVPPNAVETALDGDLVEAQIFYPDKQGRVFGHLSRGPVAYIQSVVQRGRSFLVARMDSTHSAKPLDRHLPESISVNSVPKGTKTGEWVKLRLLNDGSKHTEKLKGAVEDRLGIAGTVQGDLDAVAAEFNLADPYTEEQETAASKLKPATIERTDLTAAFTITIDPSDACDFDDALSIEVSGKNEVTLGVHIADVAAWIRPGTKFDKEAAKRSFSAYLPGRFLPMLPKKLTSLISLRQDKNCPAHSVMFTLRRNDAKILSVKRIHSTVRVNKRLDYGEVQKFLDDPESAPKDWTPAFRENLQLLANIAKRLRARRLRQEEFLNMETVETRAVCNAETGEVSAIERRVESDADRLVEECMLAANSAVASELIERSLPGLFRVHPYPDPEKIDEFCEFVRTVFHLTPGDILASRIACRKFLTSLPDDHRKSVIVSAFLRALPRATYSVDPSIHYGLGKMRYSHFTSPIRRYPDLLVHQQLWNADMKQRFKSGKTLAELARICSKLEEANDNAYFAANDRMKLHYLKQHGALENGTLYESVISKITGAGLVCDIPELGLYGFVPSSFLRGGDFRRSKNRTKAQLHGSHTEFKPGDFVYLVLDSIDLVRGSVIFRPAL